MPEPKKRGRPPGSKNKPRQVPPSTVPNEAFRHADPTTMVAKHLTLIDWAQQSLWNEIQRGFGETGKFAVLPDDVAQIQTLANALVRTVEALKKTSDLAEELAKRMTPQQLLEAAAKKIEGQDAATIRYFIKRLRAYLEAIGPVTPADRMQLGEKATDAIASLDDE